MDTQRRPLRIGNFAGFYGDRIRAAKEMVEGGPLDVITGDFLAELTMLILWKAKQKDPNGGYAKTFLTQMEEVLGTCLDRGIKVVANAGGLNPAGLATEVGSLADRLGLDAKVAHLTGDDIVDAIPSLRADGHQLAHLDSGRGLADAPGELLTANAYLGGWGIVEALRGDADVVVCPRVTDASLVVGPAAWWHGWARDDFDALAGAVAAGHVIECGPQACGGNYSWLDEITDRRYPGFPIAEVAADGSSIITKHEGTGGVVSVGTVTAQLLYEIGHPAYLNPDAVAHFDTARVTQDASDRVLVSGVRGTAPPDTSKVAMNRTGGHRNSVTIVVTGPDIEEKAAWATDQLFTELGGRDHFDEVDVHLARFDRPDAPTEQLAGAHLTITVKDRDEKKAGRHFSNVATGLFLGGFAGFHTLQPPGSGSSFGIYWPTVVPTAAVEQRVTLADGSTVTVPHTPGRPDAAAAETDPVEVVLPEPPSGETRRAQLGEVCAARSGDKGGNVNIGLWTRDVVGYSWLRTWLTEAQFRELVPEVGDLEVRIHQLPNLLAVNVVVVGLLGDGVASSTRPDPQAKGLGEYIRSRLVDIPTSLLS